MNLWIVLHFFLTCGVVIFFDERIHVTEAFDENVQVGEQVHAVRVGNVRLHDFLDELQLVRHESRVALLDALVRLEEAIAGNVVSAYQVGDCAANVGFRAVDPHAVAYAVECQVEFAEHQADRAHVGCDCGIAQVELAPNVVHAVLVRGGDEQALDNLVATFHGGNAVHGVGVVHAIPLIEIILEIQTISATALRFNNWIFFRGFVNLFYGAIYGFCGDPKRFGQFLSGYEITAVQQIAEHEFHVIVRHCHASLHYPW
ncbi:Uncharacterised protein [Bifidobacterium catenulatum]|nr:Uncharacterised protein [Bifidobacterium catenulatum]